MGLRPKLIFSAEPLDMLILKTLSLEPLHSYGIARRIEQITRHVFKVNPGSLLTALQRIERAGLANGEWGETESARRARYYELTPAGRSASGGDRRLRTGPSDAVLRLLKAEG